MPAHRLDLDVDDLVERYGAGQSARQIGFDIGVSDTVVRSRLRERGLTLRGRNDYTPHVEQAHAARRGQVDTVETKRRRAIGRFVSECDGGSHTIEPAFAALLDERGMSYTRQHPVDIYCLDFALEEPAIAVELVYASRYSRNDAATRSRVEQLLDGGWHVVEISAAKRVEYLPGAADYLVAFHQSLRSDPPATCQHRMVRADGHPAGSHRTYGDEGA